ncbi:STM3941 family protein [Pseudoalteromonas sp. S3431]|uniref:STM3941 family protein n=1 Tax=Pseudoalteromonas sp. S3431 TaxID=579537 RepID=UPI0012FB85EC|nr:STM3941 family protein [Pseudoalteromonas sp. S3431]
MQIEISKRKAIFYALLSLLIGPPLIVYGVYWLNIGKISLTYSILFTALGLMMSVYSYAQFLIVRSTCLGLIFTPEGLIDNSTLPNDILIEWSNVKLINCPDLNPPPHFSIHLNDDNKFFSNLNWFSKLYFKITKMWYKTPIVLVTENLRCTAKELDAILEEYSSLYVQ